MGLAEKQCHMADPRLNIRHGFVLSAGVQDPEAKLLMEEIMAAASPEEAARIGRGAQRSRPHLVTPDWETAKLFVMFAGLKAKVCI